MTLSDALMALVTGKSLTREQAHDTFAQLMGGQATPVQLASLLIALRMKGESVDEITGAAEAMIAATVPVHSKASVVVDTCGTGGDGQNSFNVSTAAAFVVAGAGYTVAKHGNRSVSSPCGSADVLEELGFPLSAAPSVIEACLDKAGIAFLFAPNFHPAMRHAMPVRKELGIRTVFNLLGPLTNPARPNVQLVGVFDPIWLKPLAKALAQLGVRNGFVVHGQGHDEVVLSGATQVAEIREGRISMRTWSPKEFGLRRQPSPLKVGSRARQAELMLQILQGKKSAYRDTVCVNAAAAILAASRQTGNAGRGLTLFDAFAIAQHSLDERKALGKFELLRDTLRAAEKHG